LEYDRVGHTPFFARSLFEFHRAKAYLANMKSIFLLIAMLSSGCGPVTDANNFVRNTNSVTASPTPMSDQALIKQIEEIAKEAKGKVGVSAILIETGETVGINQNDRFAMQSVVKLPISMAVLKLVQDGQLTLDQKISVTKNDFVPSNMRSPLRDGNPNGGEFPVFDLMRFSIVESDGTAADVLQNLAGGASGVQKFVESIGVKEMEIKHTHKEFAKKWEMQYENWATPRSSVTLLASLGAFGEHLVAESWGEIHHLMIESKPGANRLKGLLPPGTVVAHKTGTGGTRDGITSATNDVGLIVLPNGKQMAIAVFVGDSSADKKTREGTIAKITKAIFDKWNK
jgi:beta-lactamase class A